MAHSQGVAALTLDSAKGAVREYFSPLRTVARFFRDLLLVPRSLVRLTSDLETVRSRQERELATLGDLEEAVGRALAEVRELDAHLGSRAGRRGRFTSALRQRLAPGETTEIESKITHYLLLAEDVRQRGELAHAMQILSLLESVGERHELRSLDYVRFNLGELLFERQEFSLAKGYFDRVIAASEVEDVVGAAYARLAILHQTSHDFEETRLFFLEALRRFERTGNRPGLLGTYVNLASTLISRGEPEEAARVLQEAARAAGEPFLLPRPR